MKRSLMVVLALALVGLLVVPALAFGGFGFGSRGMIGALSEEDHAKWVQEQVNNGWITQKQADYMIQMHNSKMDGFTEEEYNAWVDQQLQNDWITTKQAEYMKENFKAKQEGFDGNAQFKKGRGGFDRKMGFQNKGSRGFGVDPRGMMGSMSEEDYAKWIQDQANGGWITQKQADYMIEMHNRRVNGVTEEEYNAWVDQQFQDGWITEKQAEYMKENFKDYQEQYGENVPFMMGRGGNRRGGCGMMGGRRGW